MLLYGGGTAVYFKFTVIFFLLILAQTVLAASQKDIEKATLDIATLYTTNEQGELTNTHSSLTPQQQLKLQKTVEDISRQQILIKEQQQEAIKVILESQQLDVLALAQQYGVDDQKHIQQILPEVLIMASMSIPKQSLINWAEELSKVNGKLLFRGFIEGDPVKTAERMGELFDGNDNWQVDIDPMAFREFNVNQVPAVVVLPPQKTCLSDSCPTRVAEVVYGDIPLQAALEQVAFYGGAAKQAAKDLLNQYRGAK